VQVVKYLAGWPLAEVADFANLVGAYVATQHGATPPITPDALNNEQWNNETMSNE
jgi:sugar/nucleoside kinase (ribokinase family)